MPENKLIKSRIWMVALIVIVSSVSAGLLTAINICTKQRIALNEEIKLKRCVLDGFDIPYERKDVIDIFDKKVEVKEIDGTTYYQYYDKGRITAIAFKMKGPGFWGPISAIVALSPDLNVVENVAIVHQEETPGLGGRITESEFLDQFKGKPVEPEISVEAITGATMTSRAFERIINENVKLFRKEFKKT